MSVNRKIVLGARPQGLPGKEQFSFVEEALPVPKPGQALVKTLYVSVDPYMRGRMNAAKSYAKPYEVGGLMGGGAIGQVVDPGDTALRKGDMVSGGWGWQTYAAVDAASLQAIDPGLVPVTAALGILGMTGLTAYFGLLHIGKPQPGETVVVSGAGGAVGMVVAQIAKIKGAHVVAISGSEEKNEYLKNELGVDEVINYKTDDLEEALDKACPNGVDVYFENVGGEISDRVLARINKNARIPICGQIALYNLKEQDQGPRVQNILLKNTSLMQGFLVGDYAEHFAEGTRELAGWLREGRLKNAENITEGFERIPESFLGLFSGDNLGKQLVKVAEAESLE
ncbi:NADP-dependent oxidoreductase [Paenibacillus sp. S150]|uniref:NADP-dependent oxidoreductase n=1 Tax=Paenibacillus sp. S150 TaxID=2749826 RepID=UPI001C580FDE|nr:NADP-dependent oxidoreductase [Paenibacillus sp. S150]MBW4085303.1 NADP-dependent oxidoreductase [Paenibacillus sp. S150]